VPDVEISPPPTDMKGWKYHCNDEAVTEAVFKQVQQDHEEWIKNRDKLAAAKLAEEAKLEKKGKKNVTKIRKG